MTNLANSLQVFHSSGLEHCKAAVNMVQSMQEMANLCGNTSASSVGTPLHKVLLVKQAPSFSPFFLSFILFLRSLTHTTQPYPLTHLHTQSPLDFPNHYLSIQPQTVLLITNYSKCLTITTKPVAVTLPFLFLLLYYFCYNNKL